MNTPQRFPLATYLRTVIIDLSSMLTDIDKYDVEHVQKISGETFRAAQIFLGALPILLAYPFLQKYFAKGITLGSVKG